jgi:polysaccharide export outer membrane protein
MKNLIYIILAVFALSSCSTLNKSRMLKTPTNYEFKQFVDSISLKSAYRIAIDDEVSILMYSNDGYNFISLTGGGSIGNQVGSSQNSNQRANRGGNRGGNQGGASGVFFKVRLDSTIKVPLIGRIPVVGLTLDELENKIEQLLTTQFNSPFAIVTISNRRVYLFQGGNTARIIYLENENSNLFEILANVGGVSEASNASRIKLIRGNLDNPEIYLIDLSTIKGIKTANLNLKAGDIIYIDPFINYGNRITNDIGSILSLFSSILLVYSITQNNN